MSPLRHSTNEITSGIIHLFGMVLVAALLLPLVVFASLYGTVWQIISFVVYGIFMTLLYLVSTIYHFLPYTRLRGKEILQRIDHSMVYLFIAATYTPVCLLVLPDSKGWMVFGILWTLAAIGVTLKMKKVTTHPFVPLTLYLTMGWLIIFFLPILRTTMSPTALNLLVLGGVSYTVGVLFFVLESKLRQRKYFWMHEIFHIFVLLGTVLHTHMMFLLV